MGEKEKSEVGWKKVASEYFELATIGALPQFYHSNYSSLKVVWLIVFLIGLSVTIFHTIIIIQTYLSYPVQIQILMKSNESLEFPAVTVCNLNPVKKSKIRCSKYQALVEMQEKYRNVSIFDKYSHEVISKVLDLVDNYDECNETRAKRSLDPEQNGMMEEKVRVKRNAEGPTCPPCTCPTQAPDQYDSTEAHITPPEHTSEKKTSKKNVTEPGKHFSTSSSTSTTSPSTTVVPKKLEIAVEEISKDKATADYFYEELKRYNWLQKLEDKDRHKYNDFLKFSKLRDYLDIIDLVTFTRDGFDKYGYTFDEFVTECTIDDVSCDQETWFSRMVSNKYGNCYTFNKAKDHSKKNKGSMETVHTAKTAGSQNGLRLTLNINYSEYVGLLGAAYGIRVSIHSPDIKPTPADFGFNAPPGMKTSVAIRRSEIIRLREPYKTNCTTEFPKEYALYVDKTTSYSLHLCKVGCKDAHLHERCGCVTKVQDAPDPNARNLTTCDIFNTTQRTCRLVVETLFYLPSTSPTALKCNCQPGCNEVEYLPSFSHSKWPSKSYQQLKVLNFPTKHEVSGIFLRSMKAKTASFNYSFKHKEKIDVDKNLVRLKIHYETLIYELVEELPLYPMSKLWADFGGVAGLYLGMTAVSLTEIFQLCFLVVFNFFIVRRRITVKPESPPNPGQPPKPAEIYGNRGDRFSFIYY